VKREYETEGEPRTQQRAVKPLMNEKKTSGHHKQQSTNYNCPFRKNSSEYHQQSRVFPCEIEKNIIISTYL
jgi:hypothetical protein